MTQSLAAATSLIDLVTHDWKSTHFCQIKKGRKNKRLKRERKGGKQKDNKREINLSGLRSELDDNLEQWHNLTEENKKKVSPSKRLCLKKKKKYIYMIIHTYALHIKEYRQSKPEEKKKQLGNLIKAYQNHIDEESNRCKFLENAYLKIFQAFFVCVGTKQQILTDAPDPVDALNEARAKLLEAQKAFLDVEEMKMQVQSYENELKSLKNQEITVRNLKEQLESKEIEMQQKMSQAVLEETQRVEKEYEALLQAAKQTENEQRAQVSFFKKIKQNNAECLKHKHMHMYVYMCIVTREKKGITGIAKTI
ncbi:hypothetical protein RFI_01030 [Reticulomyxa filosa]|uniref:Cux N-terminal domain-containing protein n=1 Tax=Reticulomyxa filosa TaxID=46433 RepID=X6PD95_RETFI|nr:hypothetical protein RFI_01030 [Reticulomyxa filosa]|eukprot:ETO36029.1 hypothetical protein RFI_01030 [Reticulomyxa filosa]